MGDVIGPEVLVRKRAQKQLDKVNQLIKKATSMEELIPLLEFKQEHENTIKQTYITGGNNEHRDTPTDTNGGDPETQRTVSPNEPQLIYIDGDSLLSANDEDGGEADTKGNKNAGRDPDDFIIP